jgi:hypothetical protein
MYNWTNELGYFDRVLTFDTEDSKKHNIEYKPNFYIINNQQNNICKEYDLFFAGKFNSLRFTVVNKIINQVKNSAIKYFIKLWPAYKIFSHSHLLYILMQKFKFRSSWIRNYLLNYEAVEGILKGEYLIANSLSFEEIQNHLLSSNVILDLPFQGQTGYTHRLIEALANGKKVITTNSNITKESFYNSKQIQNQFRINTDAQKESAMCSFKKIWIMNCYQNVKRRRKPWNEQGLILFYSGL